MKLAYRAMYAPYTLFTANGWLEAPHYGPGQGLAGNAYWGLAHEQPSLQYKPGAGRVQQYPGQAAPTLPLYSVPQLYSGSSVDSTGLIVRRYWNRGGCKYERRAPISRAGAWNGGRLPGQFCTTFDQILRTSGVEYLHHSVVFSLCPLAMAPPRATPGTAASSRLESPPVASCRWGTAIALTAPPGPAPPAIPAPLRNRP